MHKNTAPGPFLIPANRHCTRPDTYYRAGIILRCRRSQKAVTTPRGAVTNPDEKRPEAFYTAAPALPGLSFSFSSFPIPRSSSPRRKIGTAAMHAVKDSQRLALYQPLHYCERLCGNQSIVNWRWAHLMVAGPHAVSTAATRRAVYNRTAVKAPVTTNDCVTVCASVSIWGVHTFLWCLL